MENTVEVIESWNFRGEFLIAMLKYQGSGLPKGTKLVSRQTGKIWFVKSRIIHNHTADKQKRFPGETEVFEWSSFKPIENKVRSRDRILEDESQGIYFYMLAFGQIKERPKAGELLDVERI